MPGNTLYIGPQPATVWNSSVNVLNPGPSTVGDNNAVTPRSDNYGSAVVQRLGAQYFEMARRGNSFVYSQAAAGVANIPPLANSIITTGAFVVGQRYVITTIGDTDFTLIGAASNTLGVEFVATGVGGGTTGQASRMASCLILCNPVNSSYWFFPTKIAFGVVSGADLILHEFAMWTIPAANIVVGTNGYATPVNGQIGGQNAVKASSMQLQTIGASLTVAPTFNKSLGFSILANDMTGKNTINYESDQMAGFILKPGNAMLVGPTVIMSTLGTALSVISVGGYELPIPAGAS